jgi:hypothetical protein
MKLLVSCLKLHLYQKQIKNIKSNLYFLPLTAEKTTDL